MSRRLAMKGRHAGVRACAASAELAVSCRGVQRPPLVAPVRFPPSLPSAARRHPAAARVACPLWRRRRQTTPTAATRQGSRDVRLPAQTSERRFAEISEHGRHREGGGEETRKETKGSHTARRTAIVRDETSHAVCTSLFPQSHCQWSDAHLVRAGGSILPQCSAYPTQPLHTPLQDPSLSFSSLRRLDRSSTGHRAQGRGWDDTSDARIRLIPATSRACQTCHGHF